MRFVAILALISGLTGMAALGFAAANPATPMQVHAAMGCGKGAGHTPMRHLPGADCCVANICAMTLALTIPPSGIAQPMLPETGGYALAPLRRPSSIYTAPIPHPPKHA